MSSNASIRRRLTLVLAGLLAVAGAACILAFSGTLESQAESNHARGDHAHHDHDHGVAVMARANQRAAALHDQMRKLWEDHIVWTRLAIVSFAHDLPDLAVTQRRLLRNQEDIGDAIKPYYGRRAGNQLTALLKEHITGAVALLEAAKAGDEDLTEQRRREWYVNGNEVADFLHDANPRHWPRRAMRAMMRDHLDQTLSESVNRLQGRYAADVRDYDRVHRHILMMADILTEGIVEQFPRRFR